MDPLEDWELVEATILVHAWRYRFPGPPLCMQVPGQPVDWDFSGRYKLSSLGDGVTCPDCLKVEWTLREP